MTAVLGPHPPAPMPLTLGRRPLWKGRYPVPYVMFVDAEGVPDFRVNDDGRRIETINKRLCPLCGERLNPAWAALVGGPRCEEYHLFIDGPMHVDCARYAFTVCPYLAAPANARHAEIESLHARHHGAGVELRTDERAGGDRPEKMGLFFTRGWQIARIPDSPELYFHVPEFARVEWYA